MTEEQPSASVAWDHIRLRYEQAQESVAQIAASIGLSRMELSRHAKLQGWAMRTRSRAKSETTRETLKRLKDILQGRIKQLEGAVGAEITAITNERDMKSANLLVRTLEKVLELEHRERRNRSSRAVETRRLNDAERDELARRIEALSLEGHEVQPDAGAVAGEEFSVGLDGLGQERPTAA